ncbi:MAG: M20/M25/M40 family metallo-hydrolase [Candidatus Aminicenantes bacterium]|nr:MAG: M20/M25/M40 family metallo-hydrolase [Candidatus Aminicenantes bacterium]
MPKLFRLGFVFLCLYALFSNFTLWGEESLFTPEIASSPLVQKLFSFLEKNREKIIEEWIYLTEIPAPSGQEEKRAVYLKKQFEAAGLNEAFVDRSGNVIGIWRGSQKGRKIVMPAHMDTVFQGVKEIKVKREGNILKAPGIGDDTASLINILWSVRALKHAGFKPKDTYYFVTTVGEEVGFLGMQAFMEETEEKFDLVIALDGDLGKVHYGALGFGGGRITFRGPGAHTMQSRGVPNPNLAVAKALERIYKIKLPSKPPERWTILNVGMIGGGRVRNAVSQESYFTVDLRSANQEELEKAQGKIRKICEEIASEVDVELEMNLNKSSKAHQIPGARESFLVETVVDILEFLKVRGIEVDPLGSTDANVGIKKGILSVNLGRTYGRYKHSLREEAEIGGLFLAMKQVLLLVCSLNSQ